MKTRILIFNHVSNDGVVRVAESKEYIENLLKPLELDRAFITNGLDSESHLISQEEREKQFRNVNIMNICGKISNIEIIETGEIGFNDLPIYEVLGLIVPIGSPGGKLFKELYNQNVIKIGLRALGVRTNDGDKKILNINKLVCWDTIIR